MQLKDRVKYTSGPHGDGVNNPLWGGSQGKILGTIIRRESYDEGMCISVMWDNEKRNAYYIRDLEVVQTFSLPDELFQL